MFGPESRAEYYQHTYQNPYTDKYQNPLLDQLQANQGNAAPMAEAEYRRRANELLQQQMMLSRGRSMGAARQGAYAAGNAQAGIAAGASEAATRERYAQQQAYINALQNAQQANYQGEMANIQSYWQGKNTPSGFDKAMTLGAGLGAAYLGGPGAGK